MNPSTTDDKSAKKSARPQTRHLTPIKKGQILNPKGRPKGARDVKTIMREAMEQIGKTRNMTGEEIETLMHRSGISKAISGNHQFYSTVNDRLYGSVDKTKSNVTVNVTTEVPKEVAELTAKLNDLYRTK